jgi:hypothetical protein
MARPSVTLRKIAARHGMIGAMTDREVVLSRRRALVLAATAATAATTATACPRPSLKQLACLDLTSNMPPCDLRHTWVRFSGAATTLDDAAMARVAQIAEDIAAGEVVVSLASSLYDDGHTDDAVGLHEPRLDAVYAALVERGVAMSAIESARPAYPLTQIEWLELTGSGDAPPGSGVVRFTC